jgi:ATP-dependent DNA helicase RecG
MKFVKRVGERVAVELAKRGVETVEDLLYHLPFRYEDRLNPVPMSALKAGTMASVIGEVRGTVLLQTRHMPLFEMTVGQGLSTVKAMWFRGTYLRDKFHVGQMVALYGKLEASRSSAGRFKMIQPQFEILPTHGGPDAELAMLEVGRIVPVYESLGGTTAWGAKLGSKWLRRVIWTLFEELERNRADGWRTERRDEASTNDEAGVHSVETLPNALLKRLKMPERLQALKAVHFPEAGTPMTHLMAAATPAHQRLIFEELFYLELGLELKRRRMREREGTAFATNVKVREAIKQVLPFHPTAAQKRVLGEIAGDMRRPQPMRRLLQGDVGSGKTIVAMQAALVAIENGYQTALMAPTEILATQHYLSARKLLGDVLSPRTGRPYRVTLLTGSLDEGTKREARGRIFRGETDLAIGTHALIEDKVDFDNLGLVIVDEQHRFGVQQRFRLMKKPGALDPDVLVMTATPIPRTVALTVYGDLETSVLRELPRGRQPIATNTIFVGQKPAWLQRAWQRIIEEVDAGRQAYVVASRIDEDDGATKESGRKKQAASEPGPPVTSVVELFERLGAGPLRGLRLGLMHGRLPAEEKDAVMMAFRAGEVDVLVCTTVIEVGVDVPNATVMVVMDADRFGISQLHQLRGRIGRGEHPSLCLLATNLPEESKAGARLKAVASTQDGFVLADLDLQERREGDVLGLSQSGRPITLKMLSLAEHREIIEAARAFAEEVYEADPKLVDHRGIAVLAAPFAETERVEYLDKA